MNCWTSVRIEYPKLSYSDVENNERIVQMARCMNALKVLRQHGKRTLGESEKDPLIILAVENGITPSATV